MTSPGIFLEYNGPVDYPVVDSLLIKLKKTKEFTDLNTTTKKRTYSLFVECLENICKHSALKGSDDTKVYPYISLSKNDNKIVIKASNAVPENSRDKLAHKLDAINELDDSELRKMHEARIRIDSVDGNNGAGLGFICMAFKSGNKLIYNFNPLVTGYLSFEIQLSLNKHIMRKLIIDETSNSPRVILDPDKKIYEISGESRPPDVREFYDQIINWMDDFSLQLNKTGNKSEPVEFNFKFGYFNSSSAKLILDICKIIARMQSQGVNIRVKWHYEKDDVDMLGVGEEISRIVRFPFEYSETETRKDV